MQKEKIKTALVSVSDKTGVVEFCRFLAGRGVKILSTGGTAALLKKEGVAVTEVADYTGFPEIMDGRVKTLHPNVHGGILARRGDPAHEAALREHGIQAIDLVAVNLYPFEKEPCVEQIDVGGPAMIRAAAKNHVDVTVVVEPEDYARVRAAMEEHGGATTLALRKSLAARAFAHTAAYDAAIAAWFTSPRRGEEVTIAAETCPLPISPPTGEGTFPPKRFVLAGTMGQALRYGENPHQRAAFYRCGEAGGTLAGARQVQGKELSYNNLNDAASALALAQEFTQPAAVIVKHANPCGVAVAENLLEAYRRAFACDPQSAFGGIIALNRPLDAATAEAIVGQFAEVILAPDADKDALAVLAKKKNLRLLLTEKAAAENTVRPAPPPVGGRLGRGREAIEAAPSSPLPNPPPTGEGVIPARHEKQTRLHVISIPGGFLVQDGDAATLDEAALKTVTRRAPTEAEKKDMLFAFAVAKHVKSNAIVLAKDGRTIGVGAGQMSRVDSVRIALWKAKEAGLDVKGCVLASDAFFPFADNVHAAAEAGISALIQPGGSVRDEEVIQAADAHGMAMVFTGIRHFRH